MTPSAAILTRRTLIATLALIVLLSGAVVAQDASTGELHPANGDSTAVEEPASPQNTPSRSEATDPLTAAPQPVVTAQPPHVPAESASAPATGTPPTEMKVFHLQHLAPDTAWSVMTRLFGDNATVGKVDSQRLLIVDASADILKSVESLLEALDGELFPVDPDEEARSRVPGPGLSAKPGDVVTSPGDGINPGKLVVSQLSEIKIVQLQHIGPASAAIAIAPLFDEIRRVGLREAQIDASFVPVPSRHMLIYRAEPDVLAKIDVLIKVLDVPGAETSKDDAAMQPQTGTPIGLSGPPQLPERVNVKSFPLRHAAAMDVAKILSDHGVDGHLSMTTNGRINAVVVNGSNTLLNLVDELVTLLDKTHGRAEVPPEVKQRKNQLIEEIAALHDKSAGVIESSSDSSGSASISSPEVAELRSEYKRVDAVVRDLVEEFHTASGKVQQDGTRNKLMTYVGRTFNARQNLQRAELDALAAKIASMRQMLEARERIKGQIIQRRVEELLNPALEWDTSNAEPPAAEAPTVLSTTTPTPPATPERLYQSRTESDWQRLFEAETEPAARLDAAVALLHLASPLPPAEYVNRIIEIGGELVDGEYGGEALQFAFESIPPLRYSDLANPGAVNVRHTAYLRFHNDFMRRVGAVPPTILANRLGIALTKGTDADAAFAFYVFSHTGRQVISASPEATSEFSAQLDIPVTGLDHSSLAALARLFVGSPEEGEQRTDRVAQCLELVRVLRECPASADRVRQGFESWLMTPYHNFLQFNKSLLSEPQFTSALAGLALDDVLKSRENSLAIVQSPLVVNNVLMPYEQMMVGSTRVYSGPALHGWANVANEYLSTHKRLRNTDGDRTIMNGVFRTTSLYSDGDDWPVQRTAEILTDQLHAAYADENAPLVETPMSELVPASAAIMLSQIVAITGEIPEFITKGHPKSAKTATKLRNLDRLLAGENAESVEGILGEAPVEALRSIVTDIQVLERKTFVGQPGHPGNLLHHVLETKSTLNPQATTPVQGGFGGGGTTTSRQPVDPLLLLAVLPDLTGESEERDLVIAALGPLDIAGATFADHIRNLLASQLQSRRHAQRMLREMAAKTESQPLLNMIKSIDPTAVEPAADAEEPATQTQEN